MQRPKQRCVQRLSRDYLRHTQSTLSNSGTCLTGAILLLIGVAKMQWGLLWPTHLVISDSTSAQGILTQQQGAKLICTAISIIGRYWSMCGLQKPHISHMLHFRFGLFISMIVGYILFQTYLIRMQGVPSGHPFQEKMELAVPKSPEKIKGPDNPTRQLLPIMSTKCCSGDGEGRKDKGGGGGSRSKTKLCMTNMYVKDGVRKRKMVCVCDKVVCERWCVCVKVVCERERVTKLYVKYGV